ncbi:MAG: leucine-rich repeat domain-containing protein [Promethearchaeota archaeon]
MSDELLKKKQFREIANKLRVVDLRNIFAHWGVQVDKKLKKSEMINSFLKSVDINRLDEIIKEASDTIAAIEAEREKKKAQRERERAERMMALKREFRKIANELRIVDLKGIFNHWGVQVNSRLTKSKMIESFLNSVNINKLDKIIKEASDTLAAIKEEREKKEEERKKKEAEREKKRAEREKKRAEREKERAEREMTQKLSKLMEKCDLIIDLIIHNKFHDVYPDLEKLDEDERFEVLVSNIPFLENKIKDFYRHESYGWTRYITTASFPITHHENPRLYLKRMSNSIDKFLTVAFGPFKFEKNPRFMFVTAKVVELLSNIHDFYVRINPFRDQYENQVYVPFLRHLKGLADFYEDNLLLVKMVSDDWAGGVIRGLMVLELLKEAIQESEKRYLIEQERIRKEKEEKERIEIERRLGVVKDKLVYSNRQLKDISALKGLHKLINLNVLNLKSNRIEEIRGLESLENLRVLNLKNNRIREIKGLEKLRNLRVLNLKNNMIEEIRGLENLKYLRVLNLKNNRIREIKGLENLKYIIKINLGGNLIEKSIIKNLGGMSRSGVVKRPRLLVEYCREKREREEQKKMDEKVRLEDIKRKMTELKFKLARGEITVKEFKELKEGLVQNQELNQG